MEFKQGWRVSFLKPLFETNYKNKNIFVSFYKVKHAARTELILNDWF